MATLAELIRNPNSYQNEEGKVFVGDSESGQWVTPDDSVNDPRYTNPDFQYINIDADKARELEALKISNPEQYNSEMIMLWAIQ